MRRRAFLAAAAAATVAAALPAAARAQSDNSGAYGFGAAEWMRIPTIGVDSHITDVGVVEGFYDVPWFDVGHHADSHNPGAVGNSIFNGHVVTLNAGEVFRNLDQLQPGDAVYVYTPAYRLDWVVVETSSVDQSDNSFLDNTDEPRVTLYTCTGQFNPIERNYAQRLVVSAQLVSVAPRG